MTVITHRIPVNPLLKGRKMTVAEAEATDELVTTKYPHLRTLRGGKGPPADTFNSNWMSDLNVGAVFSCRKKGQSENYALMMLQIMFKHDKTVIISDSLNANPYAAVDPVEFSKRHDLHELIDNGEPDNGHDLRTVRPPGVEDNVDAEGRQPGDDSAGPE
jgi:hypothetical protein